MHKKRHINVPVFIPHLGCPNNCVFCNQRSISGKQEFVKESVIDEIEACLSTASPDDTAEIAFFGGSFTGIDRDLMIYLLDVAQSYVDAGRVDSIRMSTRPDYINQEILSILSDYSVGTIELGLQSMDDSVLIKSKRGHDSATAVRACKMIKAAGYSLVGQMMIGLPGATVQNEINTARLICELGADAARVYPTVVFYGTELCEMAQSNAYTPLDEPDAVYRTKEVLKVFAERRVPCIRVGLCASESLSDTDHVFGGANHSAIGEMAMGELYYEKIAEAISAYQNENQNRKYRFLTVTVPRGCTSKASGQKRKNKIRFAEMLGIKPEYVKIKESDLLDALSYEVRTEPETLDGGIDCI
ncbi:MAG: radical SAM protein [Clostridia bacterium]|nr:radical SAM protein [Clostridia bacterium]